MIQFWYNFQKLFRIISDTFVIHFSNIVSKRVMIHFECISTIYEKMYRYIVSIVSDIIRHIDTIQTENNSIHFRMIDTMYRIISDTLFRYNFPDLLKAHVDWVVIMHFACVMHSMQRIDALFDTMFRIISDTFRYIRRNVSDNIRYNFVWKWMIHSKQCIIRQQIVSWYNLIHFRKNVSIHFRNCIG